MVLTSRVDSKKQTVLKELQHSHRKWYLFNVPFCCEPPTAPFRFYNFCFWVEPFGEALILAALSGRAHLGVAFVLQHSIETLGLQAAGILIGWLAVAAGDF